MPRVLLIHGIAQQHKSGPRLAHDWYLELKGGLSVAEHWAAAEALDVRDVDVAFFGDLFRPAGTKDAALPPYEAEDLGPVEYDLVREWYAAFAEHESQRRPDAPPKFPGSLPAQLLIERLLRSRTFASVAERALIGSLKQVAAFLSDLDTKDRVLQRVADRMTSNTAVVIGHSLGSIVAYEFLARYAPPQVRLFLSVGSPLGVPGVIFDRLTPSPVCGLGAWPGNVSEWVNISDEDDLVALRKNLAPLFPTDGKAVRDYMVDNGWHPHSIERYLNSREAGASLGAIL